MTDSHPDRVVEAPRHIRPDSRSYAADRIRQAGHTRRCVVLEEAGTAHSFVLRRTDCVALAAGSEARCQNLMEAPNEEAAVRSETAGRTATDHGHSSVVDVLVRTALVVRRRVVVDGAAAVQEDCSCHPEDGNHFDQRACTRTEALVLGMSHRWIGLESNHMDSSCCREKACFLPELH